MRFLTHDALAPDDAAIIVQLNEILDDLETAFSSTLISGTGIPSWVFSTQLLTHLVAKRSLALSSGVAACWNMNNRLCAFVLARTILEDTAVAQEAHRKISNAIKSNAFNDIEKLVLKLTHGTRIKEWDFLEPSTNVITLIDSTDKKYPGFRKIYDLLSEYAHPNASGLDFPRIEFDVENEIAQIKNAHTVTKDDFLELEIIKDTLIILTSELTSLRAISSNDQSTQ